MVWEWSRTHQDGSSHAHVQWVCGLSVRTEAWCLGGWDKETKGKRRSKGETVVQECLRDQCRREPVVGLDIGKCQGNRQGGTRKRSQCCDPVQPRYILNVINNNTQKITGFLEEFHHVSWKCCWIATSQEVSPQVKSQPRLGRKGSWLWWEKNSLSGWASASKKGTY